MILPIDPDLCVLDADGWTELTRFDRAELPRVMVAC